MEKGKERKGRAEVTVRVATCLSEGRETLAAAHSTVGDNKGRQTGRGLRFGQTWKRIADTLPAQCSGQWVWVHRNMCACDFFFFMLFQEFFFGACSSSSIERFYSPLIIREELVLITYSFSFILIVPEQHISTALLSFNHIFKKINQSINILL